MVNTLAYYDAAKATAIKSLIVQGPGGQSSYPYLNVVQFLNTRADWKSVVA